MTVKEVDQRVIQLMYEQGLDSNDINLRASIAIIYLEAQKDILQEKK